MKPPVSGFLKRGETDNKFLFVVSLTVVQRPSKPFVQVDQ